MKQIIPGLYSFTGLIAGRAYLIEDEEGLTLIDTSIVSAADKIRKQIEAAGHSIQDVKRILITHAHPDHVGSLPKLKEATGAQVMLSAQEKPVLEGEMPIPRRPGGMRPPETVLPKTAVDRVLADGEILAEVMGGLQVIATPGHAPGHLAFWQPEKRVLFCGDVIFRMPGLRLPFAMLTVDMAENIRSIGRLAVLDAQIVCFGHGRPWQQNTAAAIRAFARKVGAL